MRTVTDGFPACASRKTKTYGDWRASAKSHGSLEDEHAKGAGKSSSARVQRQSFSSHYDSQLAEANVSNDGLGSHRDP